MSASPTKTCPFCAETILIGAVKCRFCGSVLSGSPAAGLMDRSGLALLSLPVAGSIVGFALFLNAPASRSGFASETEHYVFLVGFVAIVVNLIGVLIAWEANRLGAGSVKDVAGHGTRRMGPIAWFASTVILFPLAYPAWLGRRSRYGSRNRRAVGVVIATVSILTLAASLREVSTKWQRLSAIGSSSSEEVRP